MLFDVAKHWLMQRGVEAMDGPINFGERDRWWGLVTEGFQEPPVLYELPIHPLSANCSKTMASCPFFNQICFGLEPQEKTQR